MTLKEFKETLNKSGEVPEQIPLTLQALWYDAKGDWDGAHRIISKIKTREGAWVHAYLHRKEGDLINSRYWYRKADRPESQDKLEQEWENISYFLLSRP